MNTMTQSIALEEAAFILSEKAKCFDAGTPEHTAYLKGCASILASVHEERGEAGEWSKLLDAYDAAKAASDAHSVFYRSGPLWEAMIARTRLAYAELNLAIHNANPEP